MARAGPQTNAGVRSMMMSNLEDLLGGVPFIRAAGLERSAVHYIVHYTVHYMVHCGNGYNRDGSVDSQHIASL